MKTWHFLLALLAVFLFVAYFASRTDRQQSPTPVISQTPTAKPSATQPASLAITKPPALPSRHGIWTPEEQAAMTKEQRVILFHPLLTEAQAGAVPLARDQEKAADMYEKQNWKHFFTVVHTPPEESCIPDALVQSYLADHPEQDEFVAEFTARQYLCDVGLPTTSTVWSADDLRIYKIGESTGLTSEQSVELASQIKAQAKDFTPATEISREDLELLHEWDRYVKSWNAKGDKFQRDASCSFEHDKHGFPILEGNLLDVCPSLESQAVPCDVRRGIQARIRELYPSLQLWQVTNVACSAVYIHDFWRVRDLVVEYRLRKR